MESAGLSLRAGLLFGLGMLMTAARGAGSLELVATIALPEVSGRIDHFAVDLKGQRLFIAALGNDTVEVVDIANNRHVKSLKGFREPQGLIYLSKTGLLYVANGEGNRLDVLDGERLEIAKRIEGLDDADNVRYDPTTGSIVVGYGKGALRFLNAETGDQSGNVRLPGHPESFQLETGGTRAFVNVPTAEQIAVVDRANHKLIGKWPLAQAARNFPMSLDEKGRRLFVGARSPAVMLVYDIDSGKVVARVPIGGDTDDLFFDGARKRIYVICGEGRLDVVRQESADRYTRESSTMTAARARTGLFVPERDRLYVAAPAEGSSPARVLVYHVN
jgi:DNA-binding beta-propeller fold protein YncE